MFWCVETDTKHRFSGHIEPQIRVQIKELATNTCRVKLIPYNQRFKIRKLKQDKAYFVKVLINFKQLSLWE